MTVGASWNFTVTTYTKANAKLLLASSQKPATQTRELFWLTHPPDFDSTACTPANFTRFQQRYLLRERVVHRTADLAAPVGYGDDDLGQGTGNKGVSKIIWKTR